jgi:hypothetical protein
LLLLDESLTEQDDDRERDRSALTLLSSSTEMGVPSRFLCVIMCCFILPCVNRFTLDNRAKFEFEWTVYRPGWN